MPGELTNGASTGGGLAGGLSAVPYNVRRNLFHMLNATWGVVIYHFWAPRWLAISLVGILTITLTVAEVLRLRAPRWNARLQRNRLVGSIIRPGEAHRISGATFFGWGVLLTLILFPRPVAEVACLVLGFGDSAATLVGTRWGRTRILGSRTLEGSVAFAAVAFAVVLAFRLLLYPAFPLGWTMAFALAGALCGALLELLSHRIDDNLTVPVVTGALFLIMLG